MDAAAGEKKCPFYPKINLSAHSRGCECRYTECRFQMEGVCMIVQSYFNTKEIIRLLSIKHQVKL